MSFLSSRELKKFKKFWAWDTVSLIDQIGERFILNGIECLIEKDAESGIVEYNIMRQGFCYSVVLIPDPFDKSKDLVSYWVQLRVKSKMVCDVYKEINPYLLEENFDESSSRNQEEYEILIHINCYKFLLYQSPFESLAPTYNVNFHSQVAVFDALFLHIEFGINKLVELAGDEKQIAVILIGLAEYNDEILRQGITSQEPFVYKAIFDVLNNNKEQALQTLSRGLEEELSKNSKRSFWDSDSKNLMDEQSQIKYRRAKEYVMRKIT